ncbi:hypothetical protein FRC03_003612 [Tulasnella sp. 419]|nr:hypothetical protein FRC03_003612 [Tulasnella sp. 419]
MLRAALADRSHWTCFVSMRHKTVEKCNSAPSEIIQTLEGIVASQLTPTHVVYMMPVLEPGSLIALAGYLLEYPFSYYPEPLFDTDPFLCSTSLVVYSCCMESIATKKRYPIIKFSCPASILETEVARETMRDIIMDRWTTRLMDKPFSSMQRIQVIYELQSVDRVAL